MIMDSSSVAFSSEIVPVTFGVCVDWHLARAATETTATGYCRQEKWQHDARAPCLTSKDDLLTISHIVITSITGLRTPQEACTAVRGKGRLKCHWIAAIDGGAECRSFTT